MVRSVNLRRTRHYARPTAAAVNALRREQRLQASLVRNLARVTLGRAFRRFSGSGRVAQARTARVIRSSRQSRSRSSRYRPAPRR